MMKDALKFVPLLLAGSDNNPASYAGFCEIKPYICHWCVLLRNRNESRVFVHG